MYDKYEKVTKNVKKIHENACKCFNNVLSSWDEQLELGRRSPEANSFCVDFTTKFIISRLQSCNVTLGSPNEVTIALEMNSRNGCYRQFTKIFSTAKYIK